MCETKKEHSCETKMEGNKKNSFGEITLLLLKNKTDSVQEKCTDLFILCPLER